MPSEVLQELIDKIRSQELYLHIENFDYKISLKIRACVDDLINRNAIQPEQVESLPLPATIENAIMTYVGAFFGTAEDKEWLKKDYEEQKATLMMTTGYTNWEDRRDA